MRSTPLFASFALIGLALTSSSAEASPTAITEQCSETTGIVTAWAGTNPSGDVYGVKSVDLGMMTKHQVVTSSPNEDCLNPQTGDAGLNPQTGDAGLSADVMNDLVVLNVHEGGEPLAIIAVFQSGMVHINMELATADDARTILQDEGRIDAASVVYEQLPAGPLKTALATIF